MKITKTKLQQIIKEELSYALLREGSDDEHTKNAEKKPASEDLSHKWRDFRHDVLPGEVGNEIVSYKEWQEIVKNINEEDAYLADRLLLDNSIAIERILKKFKAIGMTGSSDLQDQLALHVWRGELDLAKAMVNKHSKLNLDWCDPADPMLCIDYVLWALSTTHGENSPHFEKLADFVIRASPESFESDSAF